MAFASELLILRDNLQRKVKPQETKIYNWNFPRGQIGDFCQGLKNDLKLKTAFALP
jgi:hypothetical protein